MILLGGLVGVVVLFFAARALSRAVPPDPGSSIDLIQSTLRSKPFRIKSEMTGSADRPDHTVIEYQLDGDDLQVVYREAVSPDGRWVNVRWELHGQGVCVEAGELNGTLERICIGGVEKTRATIEVRNASRTYDALQATRDLIERLKDEPVLAL